ncbi:hypothetical protein M0H77_RS15055 [Providencia rettgeri]|nr:hypothetical protein [Providencia rettgeri]
MLKQYRFTAKKINFLLPSINHASEKQSTIYIYATGYFDNDEEIKKIKLDLTDLAVNSAPFTALLAFVFGSKGVDAKTGFVPPTELVFTCTENKWNKNTYDIVSLAIESEGLWPS